MGQYTVFFKHWQLIKKWREFTASDSSPRIISIICRKEERRRSLSKGLREEEVKEMLSSTSYGTAELTEVGSAFAYERVN